MGRRKKCRLVSGLPQAAFYKPHGIPLADLSDTLLPVEGLEAMRLVDGEGLSQEQAAERMLVSRPTLCRILAQARRTVARALSNGWAIRIEGGDFALHPDTCARRQGADGVCHGGHQRWKTLETDANPLTDKE